MSINSVTLVDAFADGHHLTYATILAQGLDELGIAVYAVGSREFIIGLQKVCRLRDSAIVCQNIKGGIVGEVSKWLFLRKAFSKAACWNTDVTHLLQLDRLVLPLYCSRLTGFRGVYATLHWASFVPEFSPEYALLRKMRVNDWLFRQLTKRGLRVMVHSMKLASALNERAGRIAVGYVPYVVEFQTLSNHDRMRKRESLRQQLHIPAVATMLLCFGGTRFNKGADIAIRSLANLNDDVYLLIAGKPEHFSRQDLEGISQSVGVKHRVRLQMGFIPDEHLTDYFLASDVVTIPYRKSFPGQSGPLTIAAALGIPVVCSDCIILQETVEQYGIGAVFHADNPALLADAIKSVDGQMIPEENTVRFIKEHHQSNFCAAVLSNYERGFALP